MKNKVIIAIIATFIVGVLIQLMVEDINNQPDVANKIASLAGGGIAFLLLVLIFPTLISSIIMVKRKKFPRDIFTTITYIVLVILALINLIGHWGNKDMAKNQDRIENIKNESSLISFDLPGKTDINILSRTYGYLKGQQFSLNKIRKVFPDLENEVNKSELDFSVSFKKASNNITEHLEKLLGDEYPKFKNQTDEKLKSAIDNQEVTRQAAIQYLEEINNRAKGNIESPVLETLLTYQFLEDPVKEYLEGYVKRYSTKGHSKAKGVTINSKLPLSWNQKEGERPNVIQKFISRNGDGQEIVMFMVKDLDLPSDYNLSQDELEEFFIESELRKMVPAESEFISGKKVNIDNNPGGQIIFKTTQQRLDITLTLQAVHFITIFNGKMIFLQCMVYAEPNENLTERFNLFFPLFRQIANSMVLMDQY